jgi:hypothetical protein
LSSTIGLKIFGVLIAEKPAQPGFRRRTDGTHLRIGCPKALGSSRSNVAVTFTALHAIARWNRNDPQAPRDPNQLAKSIIDIATGQQPSPVPDDKDPAAVSLGRRGGLKGGNARAASLTPEQRSKIAKKAAATRWKK